MKAGLYARVSTDDQQSQNQLIELRDFVKRHGYDAEEFIDQGFSGTLTEDKRPALKRLLHAARHRKIDLVLCWDLSRFARSIKQLVLMVEDLRSWNVGFTTLRENIDTNSANGRLVFHIFAALAEFERELLVERTKLGLRRAVSEGKTLGRPKIDRALLDGFFSELEGKSVRAATAFLRTKGIRVSKTVVAEWIKHPALSGNPL